MKRVVVTGGRNYPNGELVSKLLSMLEPDMLYVGDADGADFVARTWAERSGTFLKVFKADWDTHGKAAGPIRNKAMLEDAGKDAIVLAFPGGRGTLHCTTCAKSLGMVVLRVEET